MWYDTDFNMAVSKAEGASGGLISMWDREVLKEEEVIVNKHFILIKGIIDSFPCIIVNIYAPNSYIERKVVWKDLLELKGRLNIPWCIGGDFNEIKSIG